MYSCNLLLFILFLNNFWFDHVKLLIIPFVVTDSFQIILINLQFLMIALMKVLCYCSYNIHAIKFSSHVFYLWNIDECCNNFILKYIYIVISFCITYIQMFYELLQWSQIFVKRFEVKNHGYFGRWMTRCFGKHVATHCFK